MAGHLDIRLSSKGRVPRSLAYRLLHAYVRWLYTACYCRTFEVYGQEHVPTDGPVVFVTNHQNNLADGLSVLFASERMPVFAARADFFRAPQAAQGFAVLRVLPMYRADHGRRAIADRLPETMDRLQRHLTAGGAFALMAEGSSAPSRTLRRLKKGWARLVLDTLPEAPDLVVIPAALEYSGWDAWGPDVRVVFGEPLVFSPADEDVPRRLNAMNDRLYDALNALIADDDAVAAWHQQITAQRRGRDRLWRILGLPALVVALVLLFPVLLFTRHRVRTHPRADFRSTLELAYVGLGTPVWLLLVGLVAGALAGWALFAVGALALPFVLWAAARCWIAWTAA
ncbi:MAG: 1-acyl-sn-glycerol-3-phosphate acyltransferase [Bacteroidota bacterium]